MTQESRNAVNICLAIVTEVMLGFSLLIILTVGTRLRYVFNSLGLVLPIPAQLALYLAAHWYVLVIIMIIFAIIQILLWKSKFLLVFNIIATIGAFLLYTIIWIGILLPLLEIMPAIGQRTIR